MSDHADGGEPPPRESRLSIDTPLQYPDDGPLSKTVRLIDKIFGYILQAQLCVLLAAVVLTAAAAALSDKVFHHPLGRWWFTTVRSGTFTIAMTAAAYATHQQRHLAMDLVSRRLSPRARLVLGIVLKVFTIFIAILLYRSGMHQREHIGGTGEAFISDKTVVTALPIGAAQIIFFCILHIVIDGDYLVRGKLPPERARSGH